LPQRFDEIPTPELAATPGRYLDLDLVAMAINLVLMQSLGGRRDISTAIVGGFFQQWASAVGQAEADPNQNFFMAVGGTGWEAAKKGPKLLLVTHGTLDQITDDFRDKKDLVGFFTINITDIIQRLRARANAAGIDLSRPFFYPPGDPRFNEILTQVKRELDARIVRLRRDKKKFAAAKGHARRSRNIAVLPRVMNVKYPFAMQEMR
jgi:lysophospholipase L1-like esterase